MGRVHDRLIEQGVAQLAAVGVSASLEAVSLADAARKALVAPDVAFGCWSDDQSSADSSDAEQRFREAVAVRVLEVPPSMPDRDGIGDAFDEVLKEISTLIEAMPEPAAMSPIERGDWLRRLIQAVMGPDSKIIDAPLLWRARFALAACAAAQPSIDGPIVDAWIRGDEVRSSRYLNLYVTFASMFGLRVRPAYSWDQFTLAVRALSEGLGVRVELDPLVQLVERPTGSSGEAETWTLMAVGFEALVRQFFEPVDDDMPIAFRGE